jgi:hypothetical protein
VNTSIVEWVKDCDCAGPSSSGQMWMECWPSSNPDTMQMVAHFEPRIACCKCHRPWRQIARPALTPRPKALGLA